MMIKKAFNLCCCIYGQKILHKIVPPTSQGTGRCQLWFLQKKHLVCPTIPKQLSKIFAFYQRNSHVIAGGLITVFGIKKVAVYMQVVTSKA
jgi:hypothetical protein